MRIEANVKLELNGTVTAEVVLKNYSGQLVIWSRSTSSLDEARKELANYVKVYITQPLDEYVTIREYKAVKTYKEVYEEADKQLTAEGTLPF